MSNAMSVSLISSVHLSQQLLLEVDQNTSLLSLLNVSTALQGRGEGLWLQPLVHPAQRTSAIAT